MIDLYYVPDDDWAETAITWLSRPGLGAPLASSGPFAQAVFWATWDLSVHDFSTDLNDNYLSVALVAHERNGSTHTDFVTKDFFGGFYQPYLLIDYDLPAAVPEPNTNALLLLSLFALAVCARTPSPKSPTQAGPRPRRQERAPMVPAGGPTCWA